MTEAKIAISAVLFDLGGVFLDWDPRYLYTKFFGDDEAAMEQFLTTVCAPEWHAPQDAGASIAQACRDLAAVHPDQAELIYAWESRADEMIRGTVDGTVAVLAELLAAGVPCYAFSNMETENYAHRLEVFPFLSWFDGAFISGHEGVMKPDPRYYKRGLERFGLRADEVVFIDDRPINVECAGALEWAVVWFRGAGRLRERLVGMGLLGPAEPGPALPA